MTPSWVDVLLQPSSIVDGQDTAKRGISLLIEGRLDEYDRVADSADLPRSDAVESSDVAGDPARMARAVALIRSGRAEAIGVLSTLATSNAPSDLRLVASVLLAVVYGEVARPDLAVAALEQGRTSAQNTVERALIDIHIGVRAAEAGDYERALGATQTAVKALRRRVTEPARTLWIIAERNEASLAWPARLRIPTRVPPVHGSAIIAWILGESNDGLTQFLDAHFKSFFEQPYQRSITFGHEDRVDEALAQALFRAQCLGCRDAVLRLRKTLGQYRVLSATSSRIEARSGFALLLRTGESLPLDRALRVYRAVGPLEVLRDLGDAAARSPWLESDLKATLAMLSQALVACDADVVNAAFDRILPLLPSAASRMFGTAWITDEAFAALRACLRQTDAARTERASRVLRELAETAPSARLHQSMDRSLDAIDWRTLRDVETEGWLAYIEEHLPGGDNRLFVALAAAGQLIRVGNERVPAVVLDAYRRSQSTWILPLVVRLPALPRREATSVVTEITQLAAGIRERANAGQFGAGGIHVGHLLGQAVVRFRTRTAVAEFRRFVLDPKVPVDERVGAVAPLIAAPEAVSPGVRRWLGLGLPEPSAYFELFGSRLALAATNFRLRAAFGTLRTGEALTEVVRLAGSREPEGRIEAVRTARTLGERLEPAAMASILLTLTYDAVPIVRAASGRYLAQVAFNDPALEAARLEVLRRLVQEPGEVVPFAVWSGLEQQSDQPSEHLVALAGAAATGHMAFTVRQAARQYLAAVEQSSVG